MPIKSYIESRRGYIVGLRRHFHAHPELSLHEFETASRIERELDALAIPHRRVGETGVVGFIGDSAAGPTVLLRADIDALPIQDKKQVEYASQNEGVMHACGHDGHAAALLGAAAALKEMESTLHGRVILAFQQAEEIGAGARQFVAAGYLQGVDRVFGIHVASEMPVGTVRIKKGASNASCDYFKVTVTGKSAHVSTPQNGVDALYAACRIVTALQAIVARTVDPLDSVVVGVGTLNAGTGYNIIANHAVLEGTTRSFSPETRSAVNGRVAETARATAHMLGADAQVEFRDYASPLINDATACEEALSVALPIVGAGSIVTEAEKRLGADDFAEFLLEAPGVYAFIGSASPNVSGSGMPHHHELFDLDEQALMVAANLYADYAAKYLEP